LAYVQSAGDFGDLSALQLKTEYRSLKEDPAREFYRQCLLNSTIYKRAVGYFRSSVFLVIGPALIEFCRRGGSTKLICSPELDADDVEAIAAGYARRSEWVAQRLIQEIDRLLASDETAYPTRVLATLVSVHALEIKLAVRADRKGLYHEKIGVFSDGSGNRVSFKGSANETWNGWHRHGNFESIEVFCSWRGGLEAERVSRHEGHFDALWSETDPDVEVFSFPAIAADHLTRMTLRGLNDVSINRLNVPSIRRVVLPHQDSAILAWERQGKRGIFEHATGSGKTFTAIIAIKQQVHLGLPILLVVPSRLLLQQWAHELRAEISDAALLLAGAGNERWRAPGRLKAMTDPDASHGGRVILATMQTASLPEFLSQVSGGSHLMIVADEVHQIGSSQNSRIMGINAGARLGLSATPIRYGDPEGTARIFAFFGDVVLPKITLNDAIEAGRLVPYEYFPHPVNLTATEAAEWTELSRSIRTEIGRQKSDANGRKPLTDKAKMLLIRRSRIAKKASAKINLSVDVIKNNFQEGQSWLVYCEDGDQLADVRAALKGASFDSIEYHSGMLGDRDATMSWFQSFGGILVSIRCLDEGVDIPAVSHALILASSQNPRQFIQRRGRVLRRSPAKQMATIHDAIVIPVSAEDDPDQMSLLAAELARSIEFSNHAINRGAAAQLRSIAIGMGIDPNSVSNDGVEEE
jgi:superfamily II DNA or RNA helicase